MDNKAIFVTGTDTGVGKTLITALLCLKIRSMGLSCGVYKPFASGCEWQNGILVSPDAQFLQETLSLGDALDEISPIRLEEPLAPIVAARRAELSTGDWPEIAREGLDCLRSRYDFVVVEGVGGLLVPIWEDRGAVRTVEDLINAWEMPVVVVARCTLGTINHTLLTLRTSLQRPAHFCGLIFNDCAPVAPDDIAAQTSPDFISEQSALPIWGRVPFGEDFSSSTLNQMAELLQIRL